MLQRQLIEALMKNIFNALILDVIKRQSPDSGVFQTDGAVFL